MKNIVQFLLFQCAIVITFSQPLNKEINQITRNRRELTTKSPCSTNQYFDQEGERCYTVTGGGTVISINDTMSCGTNVLKPHCTDPTYYYICKRTKTILAQCPHGELFINRLQKCVLAELKNPVPYSNSTIQSDLEIYDSELIHLPACEKPGSFPVTSTCTSFYTCNKAAEGMLQNLFKCPKNMVFDVETEMCSLSSTCNDVKSNSSLTFCSNVMEETVQDNVTETNIVQDSFNTETPDINTSTTDTYTKDFATFTEEGIEESSTYQTTVNNDVENFTLFNNDVTTSYTITNNDDEQFTPTTASYTERLTDEFTELNDYNVSTPTVRFTEVSRSPNTVDSTTTDMYLTSIESTTPQGTAVFSEITELSLEITVVDELMLNQQYNSATTERGTSSTTEGTEYTEDGTQSTTEVEVTNFASTVSLNDLPTSIDKSNNEDTTTASTGLFRNVESSTSDDTSLIVTESTPISSDTTTSNEFLPSNDNVTTEISFEASTESSTAQTYESWSTIETPNDNLVDLLVSKDLLGAVYFANASNDLTTTSSATYSNMTNLFNEYDEILEEVIANITSNPNFSESVERIISRDDISAKLKELSANQSDTVTDYGTTELSTVGDFSTVDTNVNESTESISENKLSKIVASTILNDNNIVINTGNRDLDSSITEALGRCLNNTLLQTLMVASLPEPTTKLGSFSNETQSSIVDDQTNKTSDKILNTAENVSYQKRTISKNVALPLASAILNITDRFERRMRNILQEISKVEHKSHANRYRLDLVN